MHCSSKESTYANTHMLTLRFRFLGQKKIFFNNDFLLSTSLICLNQPQACNIHSNGVRYPWTAHCHGWAEPLGAGPSSLQKHSWSELHLQNLSAQKPHGHIPSWMILLPALAQTLDRAGDLLHTLSLGLRQPKPIQILLRMEHSEPSAQQTSGAAVKLDHCLF